MRQLSPHILSLSENLSGLPEYDPICLKIKNNIIKLWKKVLIETFILGDIHLIDTPQIIDHIIKEKHPLEIQTKEFKLHDFILNETHLRQNIAQEFIMCYEKISSNVNSLPFGFAQNKKSFRSDISSKSFIQLKEFNQATIEFFIDPLNKEYNINNFDFSEGIVFFFNDHKEVITESEILIKKINPVMSYFICKIKHFINLCGFNKNNYRFIKNNKNPVDDCWDLEIDINNKWIKCVTVAYKSNLNYLSPISIPCKEYEKIKETLKVNKKNIFDEFKEETKIVLNLINENEKIIINKLNDNYTEIKINKFILKKEHFRVISKNQKLRERIIVPHVVESSFDIDRIFHAIIFNLTKKVNLKSVLSLNSNITPYNFSVFKIFNKRKLDNIYNSVITTIYNRDLTVFNDLSNSSLSKKYLISDSIGVPYVIIIDTDTIKSNRVIMRERDTTLQIYIPVKVIGSFCKDLLFNPKLFYDIVEGKLEF